MGIFDDLNNTLFISDLPDNAYRPNDNILITVYGNQDANTNFYVPKQVHGTDIVEVSEPSDPIAIADATYTLKINCPIAARTADCLPIVLFTDDEDSYCMAIHAGWRGYRSNIIGLAVAKMRELGVDLQKIKAFIGPAISAQAFEIGPEVFRELEDCGILDLEQLALCSTKGVEDRWHFDLQQAGVLQLHDLGVAPDNISVYRECTFGLKDKWHSYRREEKLSGHNFLCIEKISS